MLELLYFWSQYSLQTIISRETRTTIKTINEWYINCRVVCYEIMKLFKLKKIGGRGIIVHIDEAKFKK
jgi:hypothetical protein